MTGMPNIANYGYQQVRQLKSLALSAGIETMG
jgi:hypothetical protein